MREEIFQEQKKQAKNLLLYGLCECGDCEHLNFITDPRDGDYAVCKIWHRNRVGVGKEDFVYMDDDICHHFEKTAESELYRRKDLNNEWVFRRQ